MCAWYRYRVHIEIEIVEIVYILPILLYIYIPNMYIVPTVYTTYGVFIPTNTCGGKLETCGLCNCNSPSREYVWICVPLRVDWAYTFLPYIYTYLQVRTLMDRNRLKALTVDRIYVYTAGVDPDIYIIRWHLLSTGLVLCSYIVTWKCSLKATIYDIVINNVNKLDIYTAILGGSSDTELTVLS